MKGLTAYQFADFRRT